MQPLEQPTGLPLYPIDVLPPVLRQWVQGVSYSLQCPYDVPASMAKGVMATALQRCWDIVVGDWTENTALYTTAAARSGSNRTAICDKATRPIKQYMKDAAATAMEDKANWKVAKKRAETALRAAESAYDQSAHETRPSSPRIG